MKNEISSLSIDFKMTGEGFKNMIRNNPEFFLEQIEKYEKEIESNADSQDNHQEYIPFFPPGV